MIGPSLLATVPEVVPIVRLECAHDDGHSRDLSRIRLVPDERLAGQPADFKSNQVPAARCLYFRPPSAATFVQTQAAQREITFRAGMR